LQLCSCAAQCSCVDTRCGRFSPSSCGDDAGSMCLMCARGAREPERALQAVSKKVGVGLTGLEWACLVQRIETDDSTPPKPFRAPLSSNSCLERRKPPLPTTGTAPAPAAARCQGLRKVIIPSDCPPWLCLPHTLSRRLPESTRIFARLTLQPTLSWTSNRCSVRLSL
jgi:hypothetical protein